MSYYANNSLVVQFFFLWPELRHRCFPCFFSVGTLHPKKADLRELS